MSSVAALIADMIRAGVDPELIGRTAEALAAREPVKIVDEQAERRRAKDRERKRLRNSAESDESAEKESIPQTPLKEDPPQKEKPPTGSKRKIGSRLPEDFKPDIEWAISQGLSRRTAEMQSAKFSDHWRGKPGKDGVKSDWPATWRNWVRSHLERIGADAPPTSTDLPEDQWRKRLAYARRQQAWSTADWGPPPGAHGCRAPPDLLEPGDGAGWGEWKSAAA